MLASMMGQWERGAGSCAKVGLYEMRRLYSRGRHSLTSRELAGREGVINVIEEVDAPCSEAIVTLKIQQRVATKGGFFCERWGGGGECKKRERRVYARMCGIRDCPEVCMKDLCFQGTGINGWLVSAVYDRTR